MSRKSALRVLVMKEMAMVPNISHPSYTAGTTILSPFSLYASLLMPIMWTFSL